MPCIFLAWEYEGHQIINRKSVLSFPDEMSDFREWGYLRQHSTDAEAGKGSDPDKAHQHHIDIDNYPEFIDTQGLLPWAILSMCDSLQAAFSKREFASTRQYAADLEHYVADEHNAAPSDPQL